MACKNSLFCIYHQQKKGVTDKFRYSIPSEEIILPEDLLYKIYKSYFTFHVLKELQNYDPQGDFSNIDPSFGININSLTRDYRLINEHNLWDFFKRNPYIKGFEDYERLILYNYYNSRFSVVFQPYYTYNGHGFHRTNLPTFRTNMGIIEYIANNGWFKYIMS